MPLVSVIVPAYNAAVYIGRTLESLAAQTHREFEAIVVDDGSSDATAAITEAFARGDTRFRVIRQENGGVGVARNTGIHQARGAYVAPLDADDIWYPTKLEEQVACMEARGPRTGLVYCWTMVHGEDGTPHRSGGEPVFEGDVKPALIASNFIGCASVPLFRATALQAVGGYLTRTEQKGAQGCEDWDLSLRIAEKFEVHCARNYLVGYRQTAGLTLNARAMSDSFQIINRRARERNAHIPSRYFRWSAAPYYYWLGGRCYTGSNFMWCLRSMLKTVWSDPVNLLNASVYRLTIKSVVRLALGERMPPPRQGPFRGRPSTPSLAVPLLRRIQTARLQKLTELQRT